MSTFDIVIIVISVLSFVGGFRRGLIGELASVVALFAGIYGAARFSPLAEELIAPHIGGVPARLIAFAVTLAVIVAVVHILANLITKLLKAMSLSMANRCLGGLVSVAKVLLLVSCILGIVDRIWPGDEGLISNEYKDQTVTYRFVEKFADYAFPYIDQGLEVAKKVGNEMSQQLDEKAAPLLNKSKGTTNEANGESNGDDNVAPDAE